MVTMYACAMQLREDAVGNLPIRMIAALHDTGVGQIENNYTPHITEHPSDDLTRTGLAVRARAGR